MYNEHYIKTHQSHEGFQQQSSTNKYGNNIDYCVQYACQLFSKSSFGQNCVSPFEGFDQLAIQNRASLHLPAPAKMGETNIIIIVIVIVIIIIIMLLKQTQRYLLVVVLNKIKKPSTYILTLCLSHLFGLKRICFVFRM